MFREGRSRILHLPIPRLGMFLDQQPNLDPQNDWSYAKRTLVWIGAFTACFGAGGFLAGLSEPGGVSGALGGFLTAGVVGLVIGGLTSPTK